MEPEPSPGRIRGNLRPAAAIEGMHSVPGLDALIERAQGGDLEAFEGIIRGFERPIRAWAVAHCPPGGDADEVAQKTFIEAYRGLSQFRPGTNFYRWIFTIAAYQMKAEASRLRRLADYHRRYAPAAFVEALERRSASDEGAEERLLLLRGCIDRMDPASRSILGQRYEAGLPLDEIARATRRSVGAIKKHLFILRGKLLDCVRSKAAAEAR